LAQRYFGRGIVEPVDDGENGRPTHTSDLIDWIGGRAVTTITMPRHRPADFQLHHNQRSPTATWNRRSCWLLRCGGGWTAGNF